MAFWKFDLEKVLERYEKFIPLVLFVLFIAVTVPGGEMNFDETEPDYNYPSLPKHVMYGVGWVVQQAGGSLSDVIISARLISVLLGGLTVLLIYSIAKLASHNFYIRLLAAFFSLSNTALVHNDPGCIWPFSRRAAPPRANIRGQALWSY